MSFTSKDKKNVIDRYKKRLKEYGYSPKSLGWDKGKQDIRFDILTSRYDFNNKHVLDIGCGFGDLNRILKTKAANYQYTGIDIVDELLVEGKKQYQDKNLEFINSNILNFVSDNLFDYAISSGMFNFKLDDGKNYEFIESVICKTLHLCKDGLAFDFLSDKVDYQYEHTFHSSPEKILSIAYKFSRNILLRNDYMPFEFSLFILKDDTFEKENTLFNLYKSNLKWDTCT